MSLEPGFRQRRKLRGEPQATASRKPILLYAASPGTTYVEIKVNEKLFWHLVLQMLMVPVCTPLALITAAFTNGVQP